MLCSNFLISHLFKYKKILKTIISSLKQVIKKKCAKLLTKKTKKQRSVIKKKEMNINIYINFVYLSLNFDNSKKKANKEFFQKKI